MKTGKRKLEYSQHLIHETQIGVPFKHISFQHVESFNGYNFSLIGSISISKHSKLESDGYRNYMALKDSQY